MSRDLKRARRFSACVAAVAAAAACSIASADAATNLGFNDVAAESVVPSGWSLRGDGYEFAVDPGVSVEGSGSLRISRRDSAGIGGGGAGGVARATQRIAPPDVRGNRVRVSAYIRTERVDGSAGLTIRVDSAEGLLFVDGMREQGAAGTSDWTRYTIEAPVFAAAEHIEISAMLRGEGTAWFDGIVIEGFDTAALPAPAPPVVRYVDRALDIMEQSSVRRSAIDWPQFRAAVLEQARGAAVTSDAYTALRYALGSLGDHHSYLMTPEQASRLGAAPVSNARTGRAALPPRGQLVAGNVGYVWLPGFAGGSPAKQVEFGAEVQSIIRRLDAPGTCGWIVDLRDNTGGNVWPMLVGIGPLIGDGEAAAAEYPDGRRVPLWYRGGRAGLGDYVQLRVPAGDAYALRAPTPYVAVLLGRRTASSGEVIAAAFRGLPRQRSFGEPTRGLGSGNRTYDLSDGAALVLTVAATSDRTGRTYYGPLEPDERTDAAADAPLASQPAVVAALRWLRRYCGAD